MKRCREQAGKFLHSKLEEMEWHRVDRVDADTADMCVDAAGRIQLTDSYRAMKA